MSEKSILFRLVSLPFFLIRSPRADNPRDRFIVLAPFNRLPKRLICFVMDTCNRRMGITSPRHCAGASRRLLTSPTICNNFGADLARLIIAAGSLIQSPRVIPPSSNWVLTSRVFTFDGLNLLLRARLPGFA
jgi:hypothetical protein